MRYKPLFLIVLLLGGQNTLCRAENLIDIFDLAIKNDPELAAEQARKEAEKASSRIMLAPLLPQLSVESNATYAFSNVTRGPFGVSNADDFLGQGSYLAQNHSLNLRQTLLNVENWRQYKVAKKNALRAEIEYRKAQQNLLFRVATRYFELLAAQGELDFARAEKNAIANQLKLTKQKHQLGIVAVTDVHESQARHDLAVAAEVKADNAYSRALEAVQQVIGQIPRQLSGLKAQSPLLPPAPTNINEWAEAARQQNLDLVILRHDVETQQAQVEVARGQNWPTIDVNAFYGRFDDTNYFGILSQNTGVRVDLSYDLYAGGKTSATAQKYRYLTVLKQNELIAREREVISETKDAYLGVLAGISHVKALNQAVDSSQKALRAIEAGFEVGTRSALDVLNAQRDLFRAQRDYAHSRYDYVMNTLRLKVAVGLLTVDDLEQINEWLV